MTKVKTCICGDEDKYHYENEKECVISGCNCKEYEEEEKYEKPIVTKHVGKEFWSIIPWIIAALILIPRVTLVIVAIVVTVYLYTADA